ncbi:4-hydroxybenzoate 3-monooxygenase [Roseovarius gahaiensis]|uniref:4-hydroxybenzoate 3-monooxygenase n=1 Tax=Roseovarius gahaiensis TaxID=2716691 RepID=A0A967BC50_9RHOB|nr:4-hydroxybenzoate 3-monooxygenase [Roseovarius gahaiensis]NHQ73840.1 4-hydroxybenzoate 3-monooxygenase [Roseovarius gahaiensis]
MRTQVAIVGGGPAGLLLAQLLHTQGIETIVLERYERDEVLSRARAAVLERGLVDLLHEAGASTSLDENGLVHEGIRLSGNGQDFRIDLKALTGGAVTIYGQENITADLYAARDALGLTTLHGCSGMKPRDIDSDQPFLTFLHGGKMNRLDCDFIAGCDGVHGPCRKEVPDDAAQVVEQTFPFGWLGVKSDAAPVVDELLYAGSDRGFALCSLKDAARGRYYLQVPLSDAPEDWEDDDIWEELARRLPQDVADALPGGGLSGRYIAPLRSFVSNPMQWGRMFLCGDAAHIVPPTGAKGLNTAASDVQYLYHALTGYYRKGDEAGLAAYSNTALARIWKTQRFSWSMTKLLHRFPDQSVFDLQMQRAELAYLAGSEAAQTVLAENYVGLPY